MSNTNTKAQSTSTLSAYRWRQLTKQTGLSKGKLLHTISRAQNGNDILATLDTLFA